MRKDVRPKREIRAGCRQCGGQVARPRRTFCSDSCVHDWKLLHWPSYARALVRKRDKGRCAECGCNTYKVARIIRAARKLAERRVRPARGRIVWSKLLRTHVRRRGERTTTTRLLDAEIREWGFDPRRRTQWDCDHILPRVEGGLGGGLENLRTLCVPCHKDATRALKARLKSKRGRAGNAEASLTV